MKIYLIYFTLLVFWLENSLGFNLGEFFGINEGLSLRNINLFILLIAWIINLRKKNAFYFEKVNISLFILSFILLISIPVKLLIYDLPDFNYAEELKMYKHWINPWIFFFLLYHIIDDTELCKKSINALNILLIIVTGTVFIELYGNLGLSTMRWGRSAGFAEANQFAGYLVLLIPLFLADFFLRKEVGNKLIKGFFLFMLILTLISTVSRGGYIAFVAGCLAFLILSYKRRMISGIRILTFIALTCLFAGISYFITPEKTKSIVQERIEISQEKRFKYDEYAAEHSWIWKFSSGRSEIWLNSLTIFTQSPIYGHGHEADRTIIKIEPHNTFLIYLINYGIIGLINFVLIFFFIFQHVYSRFRTTTNSYSKRIYLSFLAGFIGYMVAMMGVDMYIPRYIFWIYVAIVCRYSIMEEAESIKLQKP